MEIDPAARKHGISDADMVHAMDGALRILHQEHPDGDLRLLAIGPARDGRMLEIVVVDPYGRKPVIIHADELRKNWTYLLR